MQHFFILDLCWVGLLDLFLQIFDQHMALIFIFNTVLQVDSETITDITDI